MMRESQIQRAVIAHWKALGLADTLVAAIPNAGSLGQAGLTKGLADLLVLAPGLPVGFIELKAEKGRPSAAQIVFKEHCERLSIPYALTHGRDEPIAVLEDWRVVTVRRSA